MNWQRLWAKGRACIQIMLGKGKASFSQFGEDRILEHLFYLEGIKKPSYLDIGANEPILGSNTFLFYNRGCAGVLVEPDPALVPALKKTRSRDRLVQAGIGLTEVREADFYQYPHHQSGWNTFSQEEAAQRSQEGYPYQNVLRLPLITVNDLLRQQFPGSCPDFISIDVEGLDFDIVRSMDFSTYRPLAIVLETLRFGDTARAEKNGAMIAYVCEQGYEVFADTYANTIFRRKDRAR